MKAKVKTASAKAGSKRKKGDDDDDDEEAERAMKKGKMRSLPRASLLRSYYSRTHRTWRLDWAVSGSPRSSMACGMYYSSSCPLLIFTDEQPPQYLLQQKSVYQPTGQSIHTAPLVLGE
jgi:hypothetical protein